MPVKVYAGTEVNVSDEGFFADPQQWREEMAPQIAQEAGVGSLTEQHWRVVKFMESPRRARRIPSLAVKVIVRGNSDRS